MATAELRHRKIDDAAATAITADVASPSASPKENGTTAPAKHGRARHSQSLQPAPDSVLTRASPKSLLGQYAWLVDWGLIITLIFGGCCSNVFALESIVKYQPHSGLLITFVQFVLTLSVTAWPQLQLSSSFPWIVRRPVVPLSAWALNAALYWLVNMMNNWAFGFSISVPVHIILRSGGSVVTIIVGSIWGKRYSKGQILGVAILTLGVIAAALADAATKQGKQSVDAKSDKSSFVQGLAVLLVAQVLSAVMGLHTQAIYAKHGPHWKENLLWSHLFSLTFFATVVPQLRSQFSNLVASPPVVLNGLQVSGAKRPITVPIQMLYLAVNAATQYFCIQGVNRLAARSTALGVTIALNIRKLVSLALSIWLFGNSLPLGVWAGALLVFTGGAVYAGLDSWLEPRPTSSKKSQ